jgi:hypothetical protein
MSKCAPHTAAAYGPHNFSNSTLPSERGHPGPTIVAQVHRTGDFAPCKSPANRWLRRQEQVQKQLRGIRGFKRTELVLLSNGLRQVSVFFDARRKFDVVGKGRVKVPLEPWLQSYARSFGVRDGVQVGIYWEGFAPKQQNTTWSDSSWRPGPYGPIYGRPKSPGEL